MKTPKIKNFLASACAILALAGCKKEVVLVDNGRAKCAVVVAEDAIPSARFGAQEIAKFFSKTTGAEIKVYSKANEIGEGNIPIFVEVDSSLPAEGFSIKVCADKVSVLGADARGILYGSYEILKRWAGMRWLEQGDEGEYCILKGKTIVAPKGTITESPHLKVRSFWAETPEDWLWAARNNMQLDMNPRGISRKPNKLGITPVELAAYSRPVSGHCLTPMMCRGVKSADMFAKHPEYYCLVNGKRTLSGNAGYGPNPCTSNPEVLDLIASNIVEQIKTATTPLSLTSIIGNDDSLQWCECENCTKLDPKETADIPRGKRADRYWWTVNEIARRIWAKIPEAKLGGWAYQDFWLPPVKVKPDPRLCLMLSFNDQCWRHSVADPKCPINSEMANIYRKWKPFGMRIVVNRSEFTCEGCPGGTYAPAELVVRKNYIDFPTIGCSGDSIAARGPFPESFPWEVKSPWFYPPYSGKNLKWHAVWQAMYTAARQGWSIKRDYEAELEEANKLYYGKAWEGGMKEFRALLTRLYYQTEGCIQWPQSNPIGKCLNEPGSEEKLRSLMAKAIEAAKTDPDARALKHMLYAKEIFEKTWLTERPKYLRLEKGLTAKRARGSITIDGSLNEQDWQNAGKVGDFLLVGCADKIDPGTESYVRATYDDKYVYFAMELHDIDTSVLKCSADVDRDSWTGIGDHVEIMCSSPAIAPKTLVLAINSKGGVHDRMTFNPTGAGDEYWRTKGKWAVKVEKECWFVEVAIPLEELGGTSKPGDIWRVNCVRARSSVNVKNHRTSSSMSNGVVHGENNFMKLHFAD